MPGIVAASAATSFLAPTNPERLVILSDVAVREADGNAVEGPLLAQSHLRRVKEFFPLSRQRIHCGSPRVHYEPL